MRFPFVLWKRPYKTILHQIGKNDSNFLATHLNDRILNRADIAIPIYKLAPLTGSEPATDWFEALILYAQ